MNDNEGCGFVLGALAIGAIIGGMVTANFTDYMIGCKPITERMMDIAAEVSRLRDEGIL